MYAIYQEWHIEDEDDGAKITSYVSLITSQDDTAPTPTR